MKRAQHNILAVVGATATGKTSLAVALAKRYDGEILSADSRQVYRGLDIGSGKDLNEYGDIPYHLIDIIDPCDEYDLFHFQRDFYNAYAMVTARGKSAILCGGSFLYIDAVLRGYQMTNAPTNESLQDLTTEELRDRLAKGNSQLHNTTDLIDRDRIIRALEINESEHNDAIISDRIQPELNPIVLTIDWSRERRTARIKQRLKARFEEGMVEEVERLHQSGIDWDKLNFFGLEYRFIAQYLQQELNYNDMQQKLASAITKFAKRQDTWLRKLQRNGIKIHALNPDNDLLEQATSIIDRESN